MRRNNSRIKLPGKSFRKLKTFGRQKLLFDFLSAVAGRPERNGKTRDGAREQSPRKSPHTHLRRRGGLVRDGIDVVKILLAAVCFRATFRPVAFRRVSVTLLARHTVGRHIYWRGGGKDEGRSFVYVHCAVMPIYVSSLY